MIVLLSPAKKLELKQENYPIPVSTPDFSNESQALINILKQLSVSEVGQLMGLSQNLSELNFERFQAWQKNPVIEATCPAGFLFKGDVYQGLQINNFDKKQLTFAQKTLRILSGLYGLLKPMDLIQPYRLEMGTKLPNKKGKTLYDFWQSVLTDALNATIEPLMKKDSQFALINLASNEYFNALNKKAIKAPIVHPVFKDEKNGQYKIISFYAKKARGLMAKFIIDHQLSNPEELKHFNYDGYYFKGALSEKGQMIFFRDYSDRSATD